MLGLILIYFLGRTLYRLAEQKELNKWLWTIVGIIAYYAGGFCAGMLSVILGIVQGEMGFGESLFLGLFGGMIGWGTVYLILRQQKTKVTTSEALDSDMTV